MSESRALCRLDELEATGGRSVEVDGRPLMVIRHQEQVHAYLNQCPHQHVELNWQPDRFFDPDGLYLQCSLHGALFRPESGVCIFGPCAGQSLTPVPVEIREGQVWLQADFTGT
ncbi:MAG: Rieske (2Fe-2S) protein [Gammaproteobacteria bacterium]|nr:MAG: Rieske (2Fe-2S) protein [Gammaproteobacteria bacterium]